MKYSQLNPILLRHPHFLFFSFSLGFWHTIIYNHLNVINVKNQLLPGKLSHLFLKYQKKKKKIYPGIVATILGKIMEDIMRSNYTNLGQTSSCLVTPI